jgi:hypothetical protein
MKREVMMTGRFSGYQESTMKNMNPLIDFNEYLTYMKEVKNNMNSNKENVNLKHSLMDNHGAEVAANAPLLRIKVYIHNEAI